MLLTVVAGISLLPQHVVARSPLPHLAFALLLNNHLAEIRTDTGQVMADTVLSSQPVPPSLRFYGHYLSLTSNGQTLYAIVLGDPRRASHLAIIDAATGTVRSRVVLPRGMVFHGVAVGPRTGQVYLFGNRGGDAFIALLNPSTGRVVRSTTVRRSRQDGLQWRIYEGIVRSDEQTAFISYWRGGAVGVDAVALPSFIRRTCGATTSGCVSSNFESLAEYRGHIIIQDKRSTNGFVALKLGGKRAARYTLRMGGDQHRGDWALDPRTGRIYQLGSCGYTGGLSALNLQNDQTQTLVLSYASQDICGERITVGHASMVVIGRTQLVIPQLGHPGEVLLVNGENGGRLLHRVSVSADVIDVAAS